MGVLSERVDYDGLAKTMAALGYPLRLKILHTLREPRAARDIVVEPSRSTGRAAARQTVELHIQKLMLAGLVRSEGRSVRGRDIQHYGVDPQRLWAFTEQVRRLSATYMGHGMPADVTQVMTAKARRQARPNHPHLVLVHGLGEGRTFRLERGASTLGRSADATVSLDYDAFVSLEHARISWSHKGGSIEDLNSRNGTMLNWVPVEPGERVALQPADVIGVGRSLLCLRG